MVYPRILLFLVGTTLASCHVLRNGKPSKHKDYYPGKPAVFIGRTTSTDDLASLQPTVSLFPSVSPYAPPPFMQQGTNLYYKPRFVLPSGTILPSPFTNIVDQKDKPDSSQPTIVIEEQYVPEISVVKVPEPIEIIESKPQEIPEPPQLPPLTMPELPVSDHKHPTFQPIVVEEPLQPMEIPQPPELSSLTMPEQPDLVAFEVQPQQISDIPEPPVLPTLTMPPCVTPAAPEVQFVPEFKPIPIPEAPVIPNFSVLDIPAFIPVETAPGESTHDDVQSPPQPHPVDIPEAPVLPPFTMPEISSIIIPKAPEIEIPAAPEFKPIEISEASVYPPFTMPALNPIVIPASFTNKPLVIPEAPTLLPCTPEIPDITPDFSPQAPVAIPEAPVLPPLVLSPQTIEYQPLPQIPEAPQLPSFTMPETPTIIIEEPALVSISPAQPIEVAPTPQKEIPPPPVLPSFEMPSLPTIITQLDEAPKPAPATILEAPVLPPLVLSPEVLPPMPQIPEAPQLPLFNVLEMPNISEEPAPISALEEVPAAHVEVPPAPVLPPFEMPALPVILETPAYGTELRPAEIPPAPEVPPLPLPAIPQPIVIDVQNEINKEPCDEDDIPAVRVAPTTIYMPEVPFIASAKEGVAQPTFWAQNIIIERFLPSFVVRNKEDLAKALEEGSSYPVITKPYFIAESHK